MKECIHGNLADKKNIINCNRNWFGGKPHINACLNSCPYRTIDLQKINAVYSFWSHPFISKRSFRWYTQEYHQMAWIMSVNLAKTYFKSVKLVTDIYGYEWLIKQLKLEFDNISLSLENLDISIPGFTTTFALGKLYAYAEQKEPFIHIDEDVFLWKKLPNKLIESNIFAQHREFYPRKPEKYPYLVTSLTSKMRWLPDEWLAMSDDPRPQPYNCGIFGGSDIDFIQKYATASLSIASHPDNQEGWKLFNEEVSKPAPWFNASIILEQYGLGVFATYYNKDVICLAKNWEEILNKDFNYAHYIGEAKANKEACKKLAKYIYYYLPNSVNNKKEKGQ